MAEENESQRSPLRLIIGFLFIIILPLAVGVYAAPKVVPTPQVGVIRLSYEIDGYTAYELGRQLAYARDETAVKSIVLILNSPGGSAAYSEELYLDVLNTREQLPVVASIDLLAASGAYYMAAAANEIYAKPTSAVGSVGVISFLSDGVFLEEDLLTTGPYKAFGGTRDGAVRQIERAKFAFLSAVRNGRGDRLEITDDYLSRAEVFTGVQAMEYGMIDDLLSTNEAIEQAASLAGLSGYEVVELYPLAFAEELGATAQAIYQPAAIDVQKLWAAPSSSAPGMYYRYVESGQ